MHNELTFVTTVFNGEQFITKFIECYEKNNLDKIRLIIVDGISTDDTFRLLQKHIVGNSLIELYQVKSTLYEGINYAVDRVKTPYYMVLGIDDLIIGRIPNILRELVEDKTLDLISFPVLFGSSVRSPHRNVWWRRLQGWFKVISNHSGGCIIAKSVHHRYGPYNQNFGIIADGYIIQSILADGNYACADSYPFVQVDKSGVSSRNNMRHRETYNIMKSFYPAVVQYPIYLMRMLKSAI